MFPVPENFGFEVDKTRWLKPFNPAAEDLTEQIVNGYITQGILMYRDAWRQRTGEAFWEIFQEDFEGFTVEVFKKAHRTALKLLREELIIHGVWCKKSRGSTSYAKVLQD